MDQLTTAGCGCTALPDLSLPDDPRRLQLYLSILETCAMINTALPGGRDMLLILMVIGMNSMQQQCTNVSSIADALGMDRKTVRKHLQAAVAEGLILVHHDQGDWPVYTRNPDARVQVRMSALVDQAYAIFNNRLGTLP